MLNQINPPKLVFPERPSTRRSLQGKKIHSAGPSVLRLPSAFPIAHYAGRMEYAA